MSNDYPPPGAPQGPPEDPSGQDPAHPTGQPPPPPAPGQPQWNPQSAGPPPPGYGHGGYGQAPYGQPGYGQPGYGQPRQTSPLAIVSLVLGILGLPCCMFFVLGIAAVVTGLIGRKQIRESQGRLKGDGMALAGIVLGVVAVMFALVYYILIATGVVESSFDLETAP
jgi:hypothetical protein